MIFEIKYMVHCLLAKGTIVDFWGVPSRYGLFANGNGNLADKNSKTQCLRKHPLSN